jgi:hypothetical protein
MHLGGRRDPEGKEKRMADKSMLQKDCREELEDMMKILLVLIPRYLSSTRPTWLLEHDSKKIRNDKPVPDLVPQTPARQA